jgi:hypothetical protein
VVGDHDGQDHGRLPAVAAFEVSARDVYAAPACRVPEYLALPADLDVDPLIVVQVSQRVHRRQPVLPKV